jgi:hypothetical protein
MAALFHDLGKPRTARKREDGLWTFYHHERESVQLAGEILLRFRYPHAFRDEVLHLIGEHMFHYEDNWSDGAVRRFIIRADEKHLEALWQLRRADSYAAAGIEPPPDFLLPLQRRVEHVLARKEALSLRDLAISGKDLIAAGIAPGKRLGIILRQLLEAVVDDPALNTRDSLLTIAANLDERG